MESVVTERLYVSKKDHTFSGGGATGCQGEEPHVVPTGCQEEWPTVVMRSGPRGSGHTGCQEGLYS